MKNIFLVTLTKFKSDDCNCISEINHEGFYTSLQEAQDWLYTMSKSYKNMNDEFTSSTLVDHNLLQVNVCGLKSEYKIQELSDLSKDYYVPSERDNVSKFEFDQNKSESLAA